MGVRISLNPLRVDPTRTTTIRNQFLAEIRRRFGALRKAIKDLVEIEDAFGLRERPNPFSLTGNQLTTNNRWRFLTDPEKTRSFRSWLKGRIDTGILELDELGVDPKAPWTATYIESAYKKGITRSFLNGRKSVLAVDSDFFLGTKDEFLRSAFGSAEAVQKLELLSTRTFEQLKGVTAQMGADLNRILSDGLAQGIGPREIARNLSNGVSRLERTRANAIARTEIIHAHAEGQLDSFERMGVEEVGILVEFSTAGDDLVCPLCLPLEGVVFKVRESRGIIPRHPNCFVGETILQSPNVLSLFMAEYTGDVIRVRTESGRNLTVTENHIFVTTLGNVPAKFLYDGLHLLNASFIESVTRDRPEIDDGKASVAELFSAFSQVNEVCRCPHGANDFHGDGQRLNSEISVVRTNGILRDKIDPFLGGKSIKSTFPLIGPEDIEAPLSSCRTLALLLKRIASATDSSMGRIRDSLALLLGHLLHTKKHGFGLISESDSIVFKSSSDDTSVTTEMIRKSLDAHPILKHFDHLIDWNNCSIHPRCIEDFDASLLEPSFEGVPLHTVVLGDLVQVDTIGCVHPDRIVEIESRHVENLPVYDAETDSTLNIANGLIVVNCRCAFIPANVGEKREPRVIQGQTIERKTAKRAIDQAIERSVLAERKKGISKKEAFRRTTWVGADKAISKSRAPVDIIKKAAQAKPVPVPKPKPKPIAKPPKARPKPPKPTTSVIDRFKPRSERERILIKEALDNGATNRIVRVAIKSQRDNLGRLAKQRLKVLRTNLPSFRQLEKADDVISATMTGRNLPDPTEVLDIRGGTIRQTSEVRIERVRRVFRKGQEEVDLVFGVGGEQRGIMLLLRKDGFYDIADGRHRLLVSKEFPDIQLPVTFDRSVGGTSEEL